MTDLDALTTDELRSKAFSKAEHDHDARFFWEIATHLRSAGRSPVRTGRRRPHRLDRRGRHAGARDDGQGPAGRGRAAAARPVPDYLREPAAD
jgi:hypothetical protein